MKPVKNREITLNSKVFVYFNLHKKVFSIKALEGKYKGKVIAHSEKVNLKNCLFKVSEKGRQKVLREKQKNVHAGVVGFLLSEEKDQEENLIKVTYDPYVYSNFIEADTKKKVLESECAYLREKSVYIPKK